MYSKQSSSASVKITNSPALISPLACPADRRVVTFRDADLTGGGLMQWLKLPDFKVGGRGFKPSLAFKFHRKKVSSPLTRKSSILWGASVTGLRQPGLEVRIRCPEDSVISPSSGGCLGTAQPISAQNPIHSFPGADIYLGTVIY